MAVTCIAMMHIAKANDSFMKKHCFRASALAPQQHYQQPCVRMALYSDVFQAGLH